MDSIIDVSNKVRQNVVRQAEKRGNAKVTRLVEACTKHMRKQYENQNVSPLSDGSPAPEMADAFGEAVSSILSTLTSEYEQNLHEKETELRRTKMSLQKCRERMATPGGVDSSALEEERRKMAIERQLTNEHANTLSKQTKKLKDEHKSLQVQTSLQLTVSARERSDIALSAGIRLTPFPVPNLPSHPCRSLRSTSTSLRCG